MVSGLVGCPLGFPIIFGSRVWGVSGFGGVCVRARRLQAKLQLPFFESSSAEAGGDAADDNSKHAVVNHVLAADKYRGPTYYFELE